MSINRLNSNEVHAVSGGMTPGGAAFLLGYLMVVNLTVTNSLMGSIGVVKGEAAFLSPFKVLFSLGGTAVIFGLGYGSDRLYRSVFPSPENKEEL